MLFFESPHIYGHILGGHPFNVPVEIETIGAFSMPGPCHASASGYVVTVRGGQMSRIPDIASIGSRVISFSDYVSPGAELVVGKVDGKHRVTTGG